MALDPAIKMRYSAPLSEFNPRSNWLAYQNRFKDPFHYLSTHGIEKVCEMLLQQLSPKEIARQLNIHQNILMRWIQADDARLEAYEWAFQQEADNQMYEGRDIIDNAHPDSDSLKKASLQANHRMAMAKGFGAKRWGNKVSVDQNMTATVSYNFNIALDDRQKAQVIEGESRRLQPNTPTALDIEELIGPGSSLLSDLLIPKEDISGEEAYAQEAQTGP